jgi:hypothetical protein
VADAVERVGASTPGLRPPALAEGLTKLHPVERSLVHTMGWELRDAFVWRNDNKCIQRAALGAMALTERHTGSLDAAVGQLARDDAMSAALAVQYTPSFGNARLHAAAIARTTDDELLVIDHLFADAPDGVLGFEEWMRRTGGRSDAATVLSPLRMPPLSLGPNAGIPVSARKLPLDEIRSFGDHLAQTWQESARTGRPQYEQVTRRAAG